MSKGTTNPSPGMDGYLSLFSSVDPKHTKEASVRHMCATLIHVSLTLIAICVCVRVCARVCVYSFCTSCRKCNVGNFSKQSQMWQRNGLDPSWQFLAWSYNGARQWEAQAGCSGVVFLRHIAHIQTVRYPKLWDIRHHLLNAQLIVKVEHFCWYFRGVRRSGKFRVMLLVRIFFVFCLVPYDPSGQQAFPSIICCFSQHRMQKKRYDNAMYLQNLATLNVDTMFHSRSSHAGSLILELLSHSERLSQHCSPCTNWREKEKWNVRCSYDNCISGRDGQIQASPTTNQWIRGQCSTFWAEMTQ